VFSTGVFYFYLSIFQAL